MPLNPAPVTVGVVAAAVMLTAYVPGTVLPVEVQYPSWLLVLLPAVLKRLTTSLKFVVLGDGQVRV